MIRVTMPPIGEVQMNHLKRTIQMMKVRRPRSRKSPGVPGGRTERGKGVIPPEMIPMRIRMIQVADPKSEGKQRRGRSVKRRKRIRRKERVEPERKRSLRRIRDLSEWESPGGFQKTRHPVDHYLKTRVIPVSLFAKPPRA